MGNKSRNLGWKIGGGIIVLFVGLVVGFGFWLAYEGDPKEIVSVADQFKPGAEWKLTSNHVEPPQNSCIDVVCPSVSRTWEASRAISEQEFEALIGQAKWKLELEDTCFNVSDISKASCQAHGTSHGFNITLRLSNQGIFSSRPTLNLSVEKQT